jgi:Tol biopolymer transport system component
VVWAYQGDVYLCDISSGSVTRLTDDPYAQQHPGIWGDTVIWLNERNSGYPSYPPSLDIYTYDIAPGQERRITAAPTAEGYSALVISGSLVVWTDTRHAGSAAGHADNEPGYNNEIYLYNLATGQEQRLTDNAVNDHSPAIDGTRVAWLRQSDYPGGDIFMYDMATRTETQVSRSGYAAFTPAVSGGLVAWTDARLSLGNTANDVVINGVRGSADIYIYDTAAGAETNITLENSGPGQIWQDPVIGGGYIIYTLGRQISPLTYATPLS